MEPGLWKKVEAYLSNSRQSSMVHCVYHLVMVSLVDYNDY